MCDTALLQQRGQWRGAAGGGGTTQLPSPWQPPTNHSSVLNPSSPHGRDEKMTASERSPSVGKMIGQGGKTLEILLLPLFAQPLFTLSLSKTFNSCGKELSASLCFRKITLKIARFDSYN